MSNDDGLLVKAIFGFLLGYIAVIVTLILDVVR